MKVRFSSVVLLVCVVVVFLVSTSQLHAQRRQRPAPKTREQVINEGVAYLKKSQAEDGTWSRDAHVGITGVVTTGLLKSGVAADDPQVTKALAFIESLKNDETGNLANEPELFHKNYVTSVNLSALLAAGQEKNRPLIENAVKYLKEAQIDESEDKTKDDMEYGGFGYQPGTRPDLSNTQFALDALYNAGVLGTDPVFQKAAVFVSRMQNLASEHNTHPWADKINDGSFIYVAVARQGDTSPPDTARPGYGSMTYSGVKCFAQAGIPTSDPRMAAGLKWLAKNYSVDINPGRQPGAGGEGYFYTVATMAKALSTLKMDEFTDADGVKHDWRADITRGLTLRQQADGSWANAFRNWQETNPDLCTAFALIALDYAKPVAK